ncbi:MAG: preprotein translocase subunit SecE [Candidatus Makaraimicrobium thalassicum]|nr:MAG: preprotein translocase subunit SecE [Candidatus Omnitrophota bacterium]
MLKIGKFVSQVKTEMKKVSWPSKAELVSSTVVVLVSTLMLALYIGVCDVVLSRFVNLLIRGAF